jgi:hypothetical protein
MAVPIRNRAYCHSQGPGGLTCELYFHHDGLCAARDDENDIIVTWTDAAGKEKAWREKLCKQRARKEGGAA